MTYLGRGGCADTDDRRGGGSTVMLIVITVLVSFVPVVRMLCVCLSRGARVKWREEMSWCAGENNRRLFAQKQMWNWRLAALYRQMQKRVFTHLRPRCRLHWRFCGCEPDGYGTRRGSPSAASSPPNESPANERIAIVGMDKKLDVKTIQQLSKAVCEANAIHDRN